MSSSARSLFVFGLYLALFGAVLLVAPNFLLGLFGMPSTTEVWIRVVGMLLLFLSLYYIKAARTEWTAFFRWSVYVRASVIVFFAAFVLLDLVSPMIMLIAAVDLLAAIWTAVTLRASDTTTVAGDI